jgi:hypothetical protein
VDQINPFSGFSIGGMDGAMNMIILFVIGLLVVASIGILIFVWANKKKYWIKIPLYRKVGNVPTRVASYKAKTFPIGKAGDILWFVKGVKKYIAPATIQSAPNEFWHWEREDGEWINFSLGDLDKSQKEAGVKYIHQDMRSQRVATANLLEQRLMQKGFWEKWGMVIGYIIFFLVISVAVVINLYMMGKVVEQLSPLVNQITEAVKELRSQCSPINSIVPAFLPFIFWRKRRKNDILPNLKEWVSEMGELYER